MSVLIADLETAQREHAEDCDACTDDAGCDVQKAYTTVIEDLYEGLPTPVCEWCGKLPCREGCTRGPAPGDVRQACVRCGTPVLMAPGIEPMCGPCRWR